MAQNIKKEKRQLLTNGITENSVPGLGTSMPASMPLPTSCALFKTFCFFLTTVLELLPLDLLRVPQLRVSMLWSLPLVPGSGSAIPPGLKRVLCGACFSLQGLLLCSVMKYRPYPAFTSSSV